MALMIYSCSLTVTTLISLMAFVLVINQGDRSSAGRPGLFWVAAYKAQCNSFSNGSDCDTVDGYERRDDVNFSLSDTTWIFLHGEHVGRWILTIEEARNVTLKGEGNCAMGAEVCALATKYRGSYVVVKQSSDITFEQLRVDTDYIFVRQTNNFSIHSVDFLSTSLIIENPVGVYTIMKCAFSSWFTPTYYGRSHIATHIGACESTVNCNFTFLLQQCKMESKSDIDVHKFHGTYIHAHDQNYYYSIKITITNSTFINNPLIVDIGKYPKSSFALAVQNVAFSNSVVDFGMPLMENVSYPEVADEWLGAYVLVIDCNFMVTHDRPRAMDIQLQPNWFQDRDSQGRVATQHPKIVISHSNFQGGVIVYHKQSGVPSVKIPQIMHTLPVAKHRPLLTIQNSTLKGVRLRAALELKNLHGYRVVLAEGNQIQSNEGFGLLLENTQVEFHGYNEISTNTFTLDKMGGGIYLSSDSQLFLTPHSLLNVSANRGNPYGGGLYNDYKGIGIQALDVFVDCYVDKLTCPGWCFFQFINNDGKYVNANDLTTHNATVILSNNTATYGGNNVFNGHFQNCSVQTAHGTFPISRALVLNVFHQYPPMDEETTPTFPYAICLCNGDRDELNCIRNHTLVIKTYPVKEFPIFVTVLGDWQREIAVKLTVTLIHLGTDLEIKQDVEGCTQLQVHPLEHPNEPTPGSRHELSLKASLLNSSQNVLQKVIIIYVTGCSPGLQYKDEKCECNTLFKQHHFTCTILTNRTIYKAERSHYWIGIVEEHVILSPNCPVFFCNSVLRSGLTLDDKSNFNLQCMNGRRGLLCSECPSGYSSVFGSFKCKECSSVWLLQLPLYAIGGIFIVALLFLFNLTLLQGTIMGVVLYTNIMGLIGDFLQGHAWGPLFFLLSVLNLQFGGGVCFYNGMDEFWKALLQFAFPFYLFTLLIIIIIVTHKCGYRIFRKARFIARRAVPVLATIMVLTYTSLVNAVIAPLRYTTLYNTNTTQGQAAWLYQPSLSFFASQHLALGILSIAVTVLYLIPFTFTMLFGDLMRRHFHKLWFSHFMDVLHGGFRWPLGFWIGLRLLVRVILAVISISTTSNTSAFCTLVSAGTLLVVQLLVKPFRDPNQFREDICVQGPPSYKQKWLTWIKKFLNTYHAPLFDTLYLFNIGQTSAMVAFGTNAETAVLSVVGSNILIILALLQFAVILVYHAYNFFPVPEKARSRAQSCWSTMRALPSMLKDTQCCQRAPREEEEPRRSPVPILFLRPPEFDESYESESETSFYSDQPPPEELEVRETSLQEALLTKCD